LENLLSDRQNHNHCTGKFIDLANELKEQGYNSQLVSAALMAASGIYATYTAAGNSGALEQSGVDKVADMYKRNLEHIQERKKAEIEAAQQPASE
jgi:hypothetical protein